MEQERVLASEDERAAQAKGRQRVGLPHDTPGDEQAHGMALRRRDDGASPSPRSLGQMLERLQPLRQPEVVGGLAVAPAPAESSVITGTNSRQRIPPADSPVFPASGCRSPDIVTPLPCDSR